MAATRGNNAQFTYDFGIAIAQSTVNKLTRLTGATLTLASAFYALRSTADEYVNTLRKNTLRFGGVLSTMKAMEQAQERLIKGQSYFSVDDQLEGMNQLMSVGIDVGKNMEWINKAAHATGKSYAEFSGMIASAIQGNSQALVDAGLMTQRATRMFDRYGNNAIARQKAVLNFVKNHKGLMNAIKNDFETIQDQMTRLNGIWKGFLQSIIGKPNDPQSFYGQIVASMKSVAVALAQNYKDIQRYGYIIGQVLGWVIRQIGHFVVWVGRQVKKTLKSVWEVTDDFQNQARSLLVWLEFWKLALVDFFNEYKGEIKTLLKLLIAYQALKYVFVFGETAIASVGTFRKVLLGTWLLQKRYMSFMGPSIGKFSKFFQSLAAWMPKPFRKMWVASGRYLGFTFSKFTKFGTFIQVLFKNVGLWMISPFKLFANLVPGVLKMTLGSFNGFAAGIFAMFSKGATRIHFTRLFIVFRRMFIDGFKQIILGVYHVLFPLRNIMSKFFGPVLNLLKDKFVPTIIKSFWSVFNFLRGGFGSVVTVIRSLPTIVSTAFSTIRTLFALLNTTNPVGWIILAVTAITLLYVKFKSVRVVVNNMFKAWWEWLKLLWNIIYGTFIGILVGVKRVWTWFKTYIITPIVNGIKFLVEKVKTLWRTFTDTAVGRKIVNFVNRFVVKPIKTLFEWVLKGIRWLLKGAATILSVINKGLAEEIRKGEAELGMSFSLAAPGNDYNTEDDTNYLDPENLGDWFNRNSKTPSTTENPLLIENVPTSSSGTGNTTNVSYQSGAIQVNIVADGFDEALLAKKVKEIVHDLNRENAIRGGAT